MAISGNDQLVVYDPLVQLKTAKTGKNNVSTPYTVNELRTQIVGTGVEKKVAVYNSSGNLEPNSILSVESDHVLNTGTYAVGSDLNTAPASASAAGVKGHIKFTADAIYVCVDTDTWKKVDIATF